MKSLIKISICCLLLLFTACGGSLQKTVDEKIDKEGLFTSFTQEEYAYMADYVISHFNDIHDIQDKGYGVQYVLILLNAEDEGKLNASNLTKLEEIKLKGEETKK